MSVTSGSASLTDGTATGTITDDDESAGAPTGLTATTGSGDGEVDLSWTAPSDTGELNGTDPATITGYQYRRAETSSGLTSATWTSAGTSTTFTVTGLTGGTTYYFQVRARNGVTPEGTASGEASASAKKLAGISIADATGTEGGNVTFTVSKTGSGAVSLKWTASIEGSDTATKDDLGSTTSGTVALTASETSKTFTVATKEDAKDENNETFTVTLTAKSGNPNITDGTATGTITDDDESAGAPTSMTAETGSGEGEIDLSWTAPSDTGELNGTDPASITGYQYRKAQTSGGLVSATWAGAGTETTFTVTGLTGGTTYYFQVRALNGVTPEGAASSEDSAAAKSLSSDADLSALTISQGTLSPSFSSSVTAYTASVANSVASMTVTPTAADSNATITVNGASVSSGSASDAIDLDIGSNSIKVVVTAENATTKTYTITVTRAGPAISIADATGVEGGNVSFTVSKTGTGAVSLEWTASVEGSDTAEIGKDLGSTTSGTVTFAASDASKTFTVATKEDAVDESNETFTVTLTAKSGNPNITDGTATGTITDDDESAGAPTGLTASTGSGEGEIDLSWTAPSDTGELNGTDPATITGYQYRRAETSAGLTSATWSSAGTETTFTVTGLTGGTTYYFQVRALNGVTPESAASGEASAEAKALSSDADLSALTISQGTLSPSFSSSVTAYTASVANNVASMTVTPTASDSDATLTVNGASVSSGSASGTIDLDIGANSIKVVVTAENATTKTYTITVTRSGPSVSIADATGDEGDSVSFTVSKTGVGAVTLDWSASIGDSDTATTEDLGTTTSGTVTFAASDTSKTFSVATAQDAIDEDNETFTVTLTVDSGSASLTDGTATGTITDDDESAGAPTSLTATEGAKGGEVDLSWTAPSDTGELNSTDPATITGYQYRRAETSAGLTSATWTSAGTETTFTVTGLTGGTTYYFQVRALNGVTPEGAASGEASAEAKAPSSDADLSALTISQGTLSPSFSSSVTAYTATVANNVASMTVTPTAADSNATITVNGASVSSGSASGDIDLDIGDNTIEVIVTAENATTKTYTITVTRSGPSISIADATGAEGGNVTFTVSKTGSGAVSLEWTASIEGSDTAEIDKDLGSTTSGSVDLAASDTSKTLSVATVEDAIDEDDETFTVTLTVESGIANLTDGTAKGTITDDDESAGAPTGLTASAGIGMGGIDLSWTAPSDTGALNGTDPATITGYQYRRAETSAGLASAAWSNAGAETNFTVSGLMGRRTYYFQVRALNGVTPEGAVSNEASTMAKAISCNADSSGLAISQGTALSSHDSDGDGLIQITTVQQLNAVRYDLDGDGMVVDDTSTGDVDEAALYAAAFPVTPDGSVCPEGAECTGYELMNDLDLDTDGDGTVDSGDAYWNDGAGWQPIGDLSAGFAAMFEGNGRSINNLFIDRSAATNVGLFGAAVKGSEIRNVALAGLCVTGEQYVGGLAGRLVESTVSGASATGAVAGSQGRIGGLVGQGYNSIIEDSRSSANVTAMGTDNSRAVGGLVGELQLIGEEDGVKSVVRRSYATGRVSSNLQRVGGLVGNLYKRSTPKALVVASYATGAVSGGNDVGGLIGRSYGEVRASYATGAVSGSSNAGGLVGSGQAGSKVVASYATGAVKVTSKTVKAGGLVGDTGGTVTASYFDADTDTSEKVDAAWGKTTVELQAPTGYEAPASNIYAEWNVDLDGDSTKDDPWDFGTSSQYPVLKVDGPDEDTEATWQEFGSQLRTRLAFTVKAGIASAALRWAAPATADYPGTPTVTYQVYRDEAPIGPVQTGVTYLDTGLAAAFTHVYRVDALLNGEPARGSNAVEASASDKALSSNANLSALAISQGTLSPDFAAAETAYTATVANSVASLTVTATAADSNATIAVNGAAVTSGSASGPIALRVGSNVTRVIVTAENVTEKIYTITVRRAEPPTPSHAPLTIPSTDVADAPKHLASVAISNANAIEGSALTFTVNKEGQGAASLNWTASIEGSDTASIKDLGTTTSGTVVFNASENNKTFAIAAAQDTVDENDETFTVTLTVTSGTAKVTDGTATGTITDDDRATGAPIGLTALTGGGEGEIDLSWSKPLDTGVLNGTDPAAVTGYQYRQAESSAGLVSALWTTAAGPATRLTVTGLTGGAAYYFQVRALNGVTPEGEASDEASATAKALPAISIDDAAGAEGSSVSFTVSKTGEGAVSLKWTASIEGSDTVSNADLGATTSGTVVFATLDTSKTFSIATVEDAIDENSETFTITLSVSSGSANVTDGTATGTITDDDKSPGSPVGLKAEAGDSPGEIDLSWAAPSDAGLLNGANPAAITGYEYRVAESSAGLTSAKWTNAGTVTSLTVTGLADGTTHYFQVRALNGVTPGGAVSNEASAAAKVPSSNADLSALTISQGTLSPDFTAAETAYTATVANDVASVTVTPTAADSNATVAVNDVAEASGSTSWEIALNDGVNDIEVAVTAEDGAEKTYTITVTRREPSISVVDAMGSEGSGASITVSKASAQAAPVAPTIVHGPTPTATSVPTAAPAPTVAPTPTLPPAEPRVQATGEEGDRILWGWLLIGIAVLTAAGVGAYAFYRRRNSR